MPRFQRGGPCLGVGQPHTMRHRFGPHVDCYGLSRVGVGITRGRSLGRWSRSCVPLWAERCNWVAISVALGQARMIDVSGRVVHQCLDRQDRDAATGDLAAVPSGVRVGDEGDLADGEAAAVQQRGASGHCAISCDAASGGLAVAEKVPDSVLCGGDTAVKARIEVASLDIDEAFRHAHGFQAGAGRIRCDGVAGVDAQGAAIFGQCVRHRRCAGRRSEGRFPARGARGRCSCRGGRRRTAGAGPATEDAGPLASGCR